MSDTWGTIRSLIIFFGPLFAPKAIVYLRQLYQSPRTPGNIIKPLSREAILAVSVLLATSLTYLVLALPLLAPENIFRLTQSRLQAPTEHIFSQLAALRPNGQLTREDDLLRSKIVSLDSRLLYTQYGPDPLINCLWCKISEPQTYLYYAVLDIITPHLANLFILAVVTSGFSLSFTSTSISAPASNSDNKRNITQWRKPSTLASLVLASIDIYLTATYDRHLNARAPSLATTDFFHWRALTTRYLLLALLNITTSAVIYLSTTHRAFTAPPSPSDRLERVLQSLGTARNGMAVTPIIRNAALRDRVLRSGMVGFWAEEARVRQEVVESREYVDALNGAVGEGRVDVGEVTRVAGEYAEGIMGEIRRRRMGPV